MNQSFIDSFFKPKEKPKLPKRCNECYFCFESHSHLSGWYLQCQGYMSHYYNQETYKQAEHCHLFVKKIKD